MSISLPIVLDGQVSYGRGLGRTIEVPTANIALQKKIDGLDFGVYYSTTSVNGREYKSITNVGTKPTVKDDNVVNAETFIFDFEGDLYGSEIYVKLLEFRRPEMKFSSFEELSQVIKKDLEAGRNYSLS